MTSTPQDPRPWQRPDDQARPASASLVDPEDDLPSSHYGGDFETTAIPRYDSAKSDHSAFELTGDPEPLPYVAPTDRHGHVSPPTTYGAEPAAVGFDDHDLNRPEHRRGTQDLGLMLLRVGFGVLLIAHGLQKAFGWWGGQGLGGLEGALGEMGFKYAGVLTYVAAGAEIGAGALLVLGLFTPVAGAVALAYLVNALLAGVAAQPQSRRFQFFLPEGHEYELVLIVVAAAIILAGPGRYGFDAGRGWARRPFIGSFAALLLGIGGGVAVWVLLNGANPLA